MRNHPFSPLPFFRGECLEPCQEHEATPFRQHARRSTRICILAVESWPHPQFPVTPYQGLTPEPLWSPCARASPPPPPPPPTMQVWDACSDAAIVFNRSSLQGDTAIFDSPPDTPLDGDIITHSYHGDTGVMDESLMGYIVENRALLSALSEVLEECSNVTVQREAKIQEIRGPESQVIEPLLRSVSLASSPSDSQSGSPPPVHYQSLVLPRIPCLPSLSLGLRLSNEQ